MNLRLFPSILPVLVICALFAGCSEGVDESQPESIDLVSLPSAGVYVGKVVEHDVEAGDVVLLVDGVLFQRAEQPSRDLPPVPLAPVEAGDRIPVKLHVPARGRIVQGELYVVTASQSGLGTETPLWHTSFAYVAGSMEPVGQSNPPLDVLLGQGESREDPGDLLRALVELTEQKIAYRDALSRGESAPVGPRLQAAWDYLGIGTEPDPVVIDESLGMPIRQYLGLPADERQLLAFGEMPAAVVEELGLIPVEAVVIFDKSFADEVWAVGLRTSAGTIGPYQLDSGLGVQTIEGSAPVGDEMKLVVWAEPPDDPTRVLDGAMAADLPGALRAEVASVRLTGDEGRAVIVIDVVAESVSVVTGPEADELIQRHVTAADG